MVAEKNFSLIGSHKVQTLEDAKDLAERFSSELNAGDWILLSGDLGAGKTQFVSFCVESIFQKFRKTQASGPSQPLVASPTYAFHHVYDLGNQEGSGEAGIERIYHWDLYRIRSAEELEGLGFWDLIKDTNALHFIEWPRNLVSGGPGHWKIEIQTEASSAEFQSQRVFDIEKTID